MAGSLRLVRGSDTWEMRIYLGRDSEGRVRHLHRTFQGTRRAAERELARLIAEQSATPGAVPEEPTVWGPATTINDAIAAWQGNGWEDLSPKTVRHYESTWRVHIRDSIGRHRIVSLTPYDVEVYFRKLKRAGRSEATVRLVRAVLHRACRLARRWSGNVLPNPLADTELPTWTLDESPADVRAATTEEILQLLRAAGDKDPRLRTFLRVLAATGMRRGEACALRWSDIDADAGTIRVDEAVVTAKGGAVVKGPKTRASVRTVAVDGVTLELLAKLREEQSTIAVKCGEMLVEDPFVFGFTPGGDVPPYPDSMSHALTRLRKLAGVSSEVHLHSIRHFHATALDPVISEAQKQARLGWATVQMARHYTDTVPEEDRRAAEHVERLLATRGDGFDQAESA